MKKSDNHLQFKLRLPRDLAEDIKKSAQKKHAFS